MLLHSQFKSLRIAAFGYVLDDCLVGAIGIDCSSS